MIQIFLFCQCRKECTCTDQLLSERLGFFLFSPTSKEPTFPFLHSKVGTRWCQLLSLGQCCHWPFRPKNGNNKFKVSTKSCCTVNHLLEMSYDLCAAFFLSGRHFFSSWFPERPIDGVDGRWKSGPVFLLHCVNLCLCPNLTLVISGVKHQVIRLGFLHLDYVSRSKWKLMAVGHVVLPINSQSHVNQREMKNEKMAFKNS